MAAPNAEESNPFQVKGWLPRLTKYSSLSEAVTPVGVGGFAWVYAIEDSSTHHKYAAKVFKPEKAEVAHDERDRLESANRPDSHGSRPKRFIRCVDSFDVLTRKGEKTMCLVLDPLCQCNLEDRLKAAGQGGQAYSLHTAVKYLLQISEGLVDLEKRNVRHGDLTLRNVFLTYDDDVRIGDFNTADIQNQHGGVPRPADWVSGYPCCPPEAERLLQGDESPAATASLDSRGDLWALGVLAYFVLTGDLTTLEDRAFFVSSTRPSFAQLVRQSRQFGTVAVPARLANLVKTLLSMEPDDREDAAFARGTLQRVAAELPPHAKLVRAREALEVGNFEETKDLCSSILEHGDAMPAVSLAEGWLLKAQSLLREKGFRYTHKSQKALDHCRALLKELLQANGVAADGDGEGQRCLDRMKEKMKGCRQELDAAIQRAFIAESGEAPASAQAELLRRGSAELEACQRMRQVTDLLARWHGISGRLHVDKAAYEEARTSLREAKRVFEGLDDGRGYVRALVLAAIAERELGRHDDAMAMLREAHQRLKREMESHPCPSRPQPAATSNYHHDGASATAVTPTAAPSAAQATTQPKCDCLSQERARLQAAKIKIEMAEALVKRADREDLKAAEQQYEQAKDDCIRSRMPCQAELVQIYMGIGKRYTKNQGSAGDKENALRNFEMALALVNIQGPRMSVQAVQVLNDLACVHISKGDFDGARQRIREAERVQEDCLPAGHPALARTEKTKGNLHGAQREPDNALKCYLSALAKTKQTLPEGHPEVAVLLNNIANVHMEQKRWQECIDSYIEACKIQQDCYGEHHYEVAVMNGNLAMAHMKRGEPDDLKRAEELYRQAIDDLDGGNKARYQYNYGKLLEKMGRLDDALRAHRNAISGYRRAGLDSLVKEAQEAIDRVEAMQKQEKAAAAAMADATAVEQETGGAAEAGRGAAGTSLARAASPVTRGGGAVDMTAAGGGGGEGPAAKSRRTKRRNQDASNTGESSSKQARTG